MQNLSSHVNTLQNIKEVDKFCWHIWTLNKSQKAFSIRRLAPNPL